MTYAPPRSRAHTSLRATDRFGVFACSIALALTLALLVPAGAAAVDPLESAGWHGRAVQDPQPHGVSQPANGFPSGWSAGPVRLGTGFHRLGGSQRVREVQKRLWTLGYRPGPVDGLFGSRTQAAVQWFQLKHGLERTGVVEASTLGLLRDRTAAPGTTPEPVHGATPATPDNAPLQQPAPQPVDQGQTPAGGRETGSALLALALLLLAAPAALALTAARRRRAKTSKPRRAPADRKVAVDPAPHPAAAAPVPEPAATPAPEPLITIGYLRGGRGDRSELAQHAGAIREACTSRGWTLGEVVRDDHGDRGRPFERPGLAIAMERLAGPGTSRLVVSKLAHLSRSAVDLTALFDWCDQHHVQVIATDVGLDTTTDSGKRAAESVLAKIVKRQAQARAHGSHGSNGSDGSNVLANGTNGTRTAAHPQAKLEAGRVAASGEPER